MVSFMGTIPMLTCYSITRVIWIEVRGTFIRAFIDLMFLQEGSYRVFDGFHGFFIRAVMEEGFITAFGEIEAIG